jgi:hypothetical protein
MGATTSIVKSTSASSVSATPLRAEIRVADPDPLSVPAKERAVVEMPTDIDPPAAAMNEDLRSATGVHDRLAVEPGFEDIGVVEDRGVAEQLNLGVGKLEAKDLNAILADCLRHGDEAGAIIPVLGALLNRDDLWPENLLKNGRVLLKERAPGGLSCVQQFSTHPLGQRVSLRGRFVPQRFLRHTAGFDQADGENSSQHANGQGRGMHGLFNSLLGLITLRFRLWKERQIIAVTFLL